VFFIPILLSQHQKSVRKYDKALNLTNFSATIFRDGFHGHGISDGWAWNYLPFLISKWYLLYKTHFSGSKDIQNQTNVNPLF
jgi:hypothetical protein